MKTQRTKSQRIIWINRIGMGLLLVLGLSNNLSSEESTKGTQSSGGNAPTSKPEAHMIQLLTGTISDLRIATPAGTVVSRLKDATPPPDLDLKRMGAWAMNYLINTPRPEFDYEPVFQCHPRECPPTPAARDVVVPCDTDVRLSWEWNYMREVSGVTAGKDVEAAFRRRILGYVAADGTVLAHVGCYNEGDVNKKYTDADKVYHVWVPPKFCICCQKIFGEQATQLPRILPERSCCDSRA